jgi:hypothetical protein
LHFLDRAGLDLLFVDLRRAGDNGGVLGDVLALHRLVERCSDRPVDLVRAAPLLTIFR